MTTIRAVIFDFGGVLCFQPTPEQIARAAQMAGVSVADFDRAFWANRLEYDAGRLSPGAYWREVAELVGSPLADAAGALGHLDIEFWSRLDGRVLAWVRQLHDCGFATAILSNLPRPLGEALRARPGFLEHFDHLTFSYELGLVKPQHEIYEHALAGLGVSGSKALFLDDRPRNIEGALAAGLEAQLYPSWEAFLASDLARRYGLPEPPASFGAAPTGPPLTDVEVDADAWRQ
ncbi:MAG TPA: HAD family phosphatase [Bryobacteraceae bacterium]|nr:HAD family phosphatase [Bryobacteraceae bacterium]